MKYIDIEKAVEILKKINVLMKIQHRSYLSNELEHIISFMESGAKNEQISLPDNLDEAEFEYAQSLDENPANQEEDKMIYDAFKAGAKWMAERIEEEKKKHFKNALSNMGVED